eukprot:766693-Hanusia_phi.AAC.2
MSGVIESILPVIFRRGNAHSAAFTTAATMRPLRNCLRTLESSTIAQEKTLSFRGDGRPRVEVAVMPLLRSRMNFEIDKAEANQRKTEEHRWVSAGMRWQRMKKLAAERKASKGRWKTESQRLREKSAINKHEKMSKQRPSRPTKTTTISGPRRSWNQGMTLRKLSSLSSKMYS